MSKCLFYIVWFFSLCFFLSLSLGMSMAQETMPKPNLEKAQFNEAQLKDLAADRSFDYNRKYIPRNYSIRELITMWISDKIARLFRLMGENSDVSRTVFYILSVIGVGYLIVKLLKLDRAFVFYGNSKQGKKLEIFSENIHEIDMDAALKEAIEAKEYKKAVRILYLASLKALDKRKFIQWQMHKTNHDYETEIKDKEVKADFTSLTRYFEYIIYGDFSVNETEFIRAESIYKNVIQKLEKQVA